MKIPGQLHYVENATLVPGKGLIGPYRFLRRVFGYFSYEEMPYGTRPPGDTEHIKDLQILVY